MIAGRLYTLQKGMEIDRKSPDCRNYLAALMNMLEEVLSFAVLWSSCCVCKIIRLEQLAIRSEIAVLYYRTFIRPTF